MNLVAFLAYRMATAEQVTSLLDMMLTPRRRCKSAWPLVGLLLAVALFFTGCGPKGTDASFDPCRMSPWGEKTLAELAVDERFPHYPDNLGTVELELERFQEHGGAERERVRLGAAYVREEKYENALEILTYDFENERIRAIAGMFLGFIHIRRHEYVQGAKHLELVARSPDAGDNVLYFMTIVALIYSEHCMHAEAIPHIERLLDIEPWDIYMWVQLGWNYGGLGDYEKAREVFAQTRQSIADGTPADPHEIAEMDAYSGFVEWNAGNTQAAKEYFEQAVKSPHAPPSARHALDALNAGSETFYARW